jgi:hypothetical protein
VVSAEVVQLIISHQLHAIAARVKFYLMVLAAVVINFTPTSFHRRESQVLTRGFCCSGAADNFTPTPFHRCKSQVVAGGAVVQLIFSRKFSFFDATV